MADRNLKRALAAMSEKKRSEMRAVVASFATVDDLIEGMRPKISDEDIAKVWKGVTERIARGGIEPDDATEGTPDAALPPDPVLPVEAAPAPLANAGIR